LGFPPCLSKPTLGQGQVEGNGRARQSATQDDPIKLFTLPGLDPGTLFAGAEEDRRVKPGEGEKGVLARFPAMGCGVRYRNGFVAG
jgi:hypothetical protein